MYQTYKHVKISSEGIAPSLKIIISLEETSTTVEAIPSGLGPHFNIPSKRSPSSVSTDSIVMRSGVPLKFALVPVIGNPSPSMIANGTRWLGILTAMVFNPPEAMHETVSFLGSTNVKGPGQNWCASLRLVFEISSDTICSCSVFDIKTGRANFWGLPLIW